MRDATHSAAEAVTLFRAFLDMAPYLVKRARRELAGRDLACWCALPDAGEPDHCHAATLIEVANREAGIPL